MVFGMVMLSSGHSMTRQKAISVLKVVTLIGVYGGLLMPVVFIPVFSQYLQSLTMVIFPFVFLKLIYLQVVIGLTFPAYLMLAWLEPAYRPKSHWLYFSIAAYFIALILSTIFSVDIMRSWWGNQERMNGLFTLLHFFAWLTMAIGVLKTWADWRRLLNYQVGLSLFMAIITLLQKVYPRLLLFPATSRVGGLLDNPIYMGVYQMFNLFFLLLLALKTRSWKLYLWYGAIALFDVAAFLAGQSRGALVGLAAGILVFGVCIGVLAKNKKIKFITIGVVACVFIAYGFLFAFRNSPAIQQSSLARFANFSTTIDTRLIAWKIAWEGFKERPITGWGLDTFHILFNQKYNPRSLGYSSYETWFDRAHNTVLDTFSMTGVLGFITYAAIFLSLFILVGRAYRKGWINVWMTAILFALPVAYFIQNLFVFDHPAAFSMSFLLYAFVIAMTSEHASHNTQHASGEQQNNKIEKQRKFYWAPFVILQLAALLLVWRTSMLPFQASRLSIQSNNAFAQPEGLAAAKRASDIWTPYLDEQTFLISRNLITLASQGTLTRFPQWKEYYVLVERLTQEEIRRHPNNTHPHYVYAQLASLMVGQIPGAEKVSEEQFKEAIRTSPKRQELYYALANLYRRQRRTAEAVELEKQARDFDPEVGQARYMYGLGLFYDMGDKTNGAKEILASQTVRYVYPPTEIRQLVPLADAAIVLNDKETLKKLVSYVPGIPAGQITFYIQLALRYHLAGLVEEEKQVLDFATTIDPSVRDQFNQAVKPTPGQKI